MNTQKNKTLRNLIIFAVVVIASGWLGVGLNALLGLDETENLGMLLWIVTPLAATLLLRAFAGDGWKDFGLRPHFRGNGLGYLVALLAYPAGISIIIGIDLLLGWVTFPQPFANTAALLAQVFAVALLPTFFKNIFEEFAWRGYLTPKVNSLGIHAYAGHILVGVIWWAWHLPYWFNFIDRTALLGTTPFPFELFLVASLAELVAFAIVLGELRLLTGSTWSAVLMHTVYNCLAVALLTPGFLRLVLGMEVAAWFGPGGLLPILLLVLLGVGLHQVRMQKQKRMEHARGELPLAPTVAAR